LRRLRNEALKSLGKNGAFPGNFEKMYLEMDDDGFTGNFGQHVNIGKYLSRRDDYINTLLFGKDGYEDRIRKRFNDKFFMIRIDEAGQPIFPDGCEDLDKEYRHKLNAWYSKNVVRRYTKKYYDARIDILSQKTLKALHEIDNQISNIIKACTVDGELHTELLTRQKALNLLNLYEKKAQLSNPYDEFGRLKEDGTDAYQIAKELTQWNNFLRDKVKYKMNYEAYENAKNNAKNKDVFELLNSFRTINPKLWEEVSGTFNSSQELDNLRNRRRKLLSIIRRRGFTEIRINEVWDFDKGDIKEEYREFWQNLKKLDEEILSKEGSRRKNKKYSSIFTKEPVKITEGGIKYNWYNYIEKSINNRLKRENPTKNSIEIKKMLEKEM